MQEPSAIACHYYAQGVAFCERNGIPLFHLAVFSPEQANAEGFEGWYFSQDLEKAPWVYVKMSYSMRTGPFLRFETKEEVEAYGFSTEEAWKGESPSVYRIPYVIMAGVSSTTSTTWGCTGISPSYWHVTIPTLPPQLFTRNNPPKVGDLIYLGSEYYVDHDEDNFHGGVATVSQVYGRMGILYVSVAENPGASYQWGLLADEQKTLQQRFQAERAFLCKDRPR